MGESNEWNKVKFTFNKNRRRKNHFKTKQKYTLWENYNVLSTKSSVIFTVKKILMQSSRVFRNRPISSVTCITGGTRFRLFTTWRRKRIRSVGYYPVILRVYSRRNQRKGIVKSKNPSKDKIHTKFRVKSGSSVCCEPVHPGTIDEL